MDHWDTFLCDKPPLKCVKRLEIYKQTGLQSVAIRLVTNSSPSTNFVALSKPLLSHLSPTTIINSLAKVSLPPAFQRNGEGTVFTDVCLSTFRGGGGTPSFLKGGYPTSQVRMGEYPHPRLGWEVPPSKVRIRDTLGYPPASIQVRSQVRIGGTPTCYWKRPKSQVT